MRRSTRRMLQRPASSPTISRLRVGDRIAAPRCRTCHAPGIPHRSTTKQESKETAMANEVRDNGARSRYELDVDGHIAFVDYRLRPDRIVLVHTEVPSELGGRG